MSDEHTPYGSMFNAAESSQADTTDTPDPFVDSFIEPTPEPEPEVADEALPEEQAVADPASVDPPEAVIEEDSKPDAEATFVKVNLASANGRLRVRESADPDAPVVTTFPNGMIVRVLSGDDPDWDFVETLGASGGDAVRGYVKKAFVVNAKV